MDLLDLFVRITAKDETSEAVEQASQNIVGKLAGAAKTAAKALAAMWGVKKVAEFGKAAFDAYAEFEQLEGGVAKLYGNANQTLEEYAAAVGKTVDEVSADYERNAQAQANMMEFAQNGWKTAGMSANEYMATATSFSAALINSLGGDTVAAAEMTDRAMTAISDNVNTFGTDIESVRMAFQGFAKQNYTMLDNLKLGYGGTKTEMERLISDANEYAASIGEASDLSIDSFADVVTAIELVQKKQGVYGTTAREAMMTIEGSINATKAAWQNLVTEFGKPDADIGARVSDMITAVFGQNGEGGLARNVAKEVRVIATNIVSAVGSGVKAGAKWLADNGSRIVLGAIRGIVDNVNSFAEGIASFDISKLFGGDFGIADMLTDIGEILYDWAPFLLEAGGNLVSAIGESISKNGPVVLGKVGEILGNVGSAIIENGPTIIGAAADAFGSLVEWVVANGPQLVDQAAEVIGGLVSAAGEWITTNGPAIIDAVVQTVQNVASAIGEHAPEILRNVGETIGKVIGHLAKAIPQLVEKGREFIGGIITGTSEEGQALRQWFADFFPDGLLEGIGDFATFLLDAGASLIDGLLDGIGEVAPDVEQAIRDAFQVVIDFFGGVAQFLTDPVGAIKDGLSALGGAFSNTEDSVEGSMAGVEGSVDKAMGNAKSDMVAYNRVKLSNKTATATVSGNAVDGTGKTKVGDMVTQIGKLQSKTVYVNAAGNAVDGSSKSNLEATKKAIENLKDRTVTITTNRKSIRSATPMGSAWGGIAYHATGGIKVANRWGQGVPLNVEHRVGERGAEAIVPLTSRYGGEFARLMGQEAAKYMGGPSYHLHIGNIEYNTDEAMDKAIDDWFAVAARRAGQYGIA